jgi:hypothetical protein
MCKFEPSKAMGFKEAQTTFELWKMNRAKVSVMPSYNNYNQSYNTVNLDSALAMQVWTAADFGLNENVSGVSIMSYQNARCHTLSINSTKTVVNTATRLNMMGDGPIAIMPANTWLDTSTDQGTNRYSGFQLFARMPGINANNYLPELQVIFEIECTFKQPAYQNRPTSFEAEIIDSTLEVIPDAASSDTRMYKCVSVALEAEGYDYRWERSDGEAGSLNYKGNEMFELYTRGKSGKYFSDRGCNYTGPAPRKPLGYTPEFDETRGNALPTLPEIANPPAPDDL